MWKLIVLITIFLSSCGFPGEATSVLLDAPRDRSINYEVWGADKNTGTHPLILLSHGSGGDYKNHQWLINTLVADGYIVAAVNHPFNSTQDNTDKGVISVWDRPVDISLLLDHLLDDRDLSVLIDKNRIGAAGFSSGGYTVLALGGAIYNLELMNKYCSSEGHGPDCELAYDDTDVDYTNAALSYKDNRIKAIFAMAPAIGPGITIESLESIDIPVYITAAADDELAYTSYNAIRYADNIPESHLELLPSGGHFIFLECDFITHIADWFIDDLDLCGSKFNVDRAQVRDKVASEAVSFFNQKI
jgi:predicted dienelactone hydrolase